MDLDIWPETNGVVVRLLGEPNHPHILETSTTLTDWTPVLTNTAPTTVFDYRDTNAPGVDRRFYRAVKP